MQARVEDVKDESTVEKVIKYQGWKSLAKLTQ